MILVSGENIIQKLGISEWLLQRAPESATDLLIRAALCIAAFLVGSRVIALIRKVIRKLLIRGNASKEVTQFLDSAAKFGLYAFLIVQIAVSLGLDATSIATVFGSAAVAIGLAFQGSLKNCIGGILILMLHPFRVGDYIIESTYQHEGIVQEITIFYTRLATLDNRTILVPNGTLADTSIVNVTGVEKRRIELKLRISYSEDVDAVKKVLYDTVIQNERICKEEEIFVYIDDFAESFLILSLRCWAVTEDFWMARCQLMEDVKRALDRNHITIQVPQIEVHTN